MNPLIRIWFFYAMICIALSACQQRKLIPVAEMQKLKLADKSGIIKHDKT